MFENNIILGLNFGQSNNYYILGSLFGGLGGKTGRNNANNKDLNRDFPKQFDENQRVPFNQLVQGRQPETA